MPVAPTVEQQLIRNRCAYAVLADPPPDHQPAKLPPRKVAKGMVLGDGYGYVMAIVAADSMLDLDHLRYQTGRRLAPADEAEAAMLFHDCSLGAVPAVGPAYGIETWVDDRLMEESDVYFEAGDQQSLVHLSMPSFIAMLGEVNCARLTE